MKLVLKEPIKFGEGAPITELNFRERVCAGDLRGIKCNDLSNLNTEQALTVAARLSGRLPEELDLMCLADMQAVLEAVSGFFEAGLKTGGKPSP